jgi:hypothetical protein
MSKKAILVRGHDCRKERWKTKMGELKKIPQKDFMVLTTAYPSLMIVRA